MAHALIASQDGEQREAGVSFCAGHAIDLLVARGAGATPLIRHQVPPRFSTASRESAKTKR
jgi:hypothetical protein